MKLKFNNNVQSADFKKKALVISLFVVLLLGLGGFVTYQILDIINTNPDVSEFKAELEELATVEQKEPDSDKIIQSKLKSPEISIYGKQLTDVSPFKSLLRAKPEEETTASEQEKSVKGAKKDEEEKSAQTLREEIKQRLQTKLQILGILETDNDKRAIVKYGDQPSKMVEEGAEFEGLRVKRITHNKLIVEEKENEFTYTIGGEED